ncbi:MAG TPA: recombinase family protein [Methylomirabilota bacterium]|nr:recombinase family protein [Methylomirabilota bacterium]
MRAAVYARKSTDDGAKDQDAKSVTRQIENARAYAVARGWTVSPEHVYSDDGISGAEFVKRPGLSRLLNALDQHPRPFDALVMSEESRLGREQIETSYILKRLTDAGVRVFLYLEDRERTLDSAMDKVMLSLTNFGAELEREKASQRTYDAMVRKAKNLQVTGGKVFGYRNVREGSGVRRVIDESEAQIVRRIFSDYADGKGMVTIAHNLNREGVKPPRGKGFAPSGIREMLHRPLYRGEIVWNRSQKIVKGGTKGQRKRDRSEWIILPSPESRIVPEEIAARVQERLDRTAGLYARCGQGRLLSRPQGRDESAYLLTGFIRCGACGGAMVTNSQLHGSPGHRVKIAHYQCANSLRRGESVCCNRVTIKNGALDQAVLKAVADALDPSILDRAVDLAVVELTAGVEEHRSRKAVVEQELQAAQRKLDRLLDALADGSLPRDEITVRLNAEKVRKDSLTSERDRLTGMLSVADLDSEKVKADLRAKAQDIVAVLAQETPQARQMLRKILADKLDLEAVGKKGSKDRGYSFRGSLNLGKLIGGEAFNETRMTVVAPTGYHRLWHVQIRGILKAA